MIELPLIFVGGVLGSSHCIGMCGPFALSVGAAARGWRNNLARQTAYSAGRIFTYAAGGALAGYFGMRATHELPGVVPWQAVLAVVAGVLLVLQGISSSDWNWSAWKWGAWWLKRRTAQASCEADASDAGANRHQRTKRSEAPGRAVPGHRREPALRQKRRPHNQQATPNSLPAAPGTLALPLQIVQPNTDNTTPPCMTGSFFAPLLTAPGMRHPFLAGMLTGLLPCGLVYAFLALAAASGNMFTGMLTMAAFGLGTVPVMVLTGSGALMLKLAARRQLFRLAAICVIITGLVTIARGVGFLEAGEGAIAGHNHMIEH